MPLPIVDGYRQGLAGPVAYSVTGDQQSYWFSGADGNSYTFHLARVS